MNTDNNNAQPAWAELLKQATMVPGMISEAFRSFHNYSVGNQLLALWQCMLRGIPAGPISTYMGWQAKGRQVRKGEKALVLCMPITKKKAAKTEDEEDKFFTRFLYRAHWFVYSQTDGPEVAPEPVPGWDKDKALAGLEVKEVPFQHTDGNCLGYAQRREVAVSPLAPKFAKVLFHELAHVLLGHCELGMQTDSNSLPRDLKEAEAEAVALLLVATLELEGQEECRGYIQNWYKQAEIPEKSAQRIFKVADQILKAGQ